MEATALFPGRQWNTLTVGSRKFTVFYFFFSSSVSVSDLEVDHNTGRWTRVSSSTKTSDLPPMRVKSWV